MARFHSREFARLINVAETANLPTPILIELDPSVTEKIFRAALEYIYMHKRFKSKLFLWLFNIYSILASMLEALLDLAHRYGIDGLTGKCSDVIAEIRSRKFPFSRKVELAYEYDLNSLKVFVVPAL